MNHSFEIAIIVTAIAVAIDIAFNNCRSLSFLMRGKSNEPTTNELDMIGDLINEIDELRDDLGYGDDEDQVIKDKIADRQKVIDLLLTRKKSEANG